VLVNSFVISRVDYCNGVFSWCTLHQLNRLQSILGASARVLYGGSRYQHVTSLLRDKLHRLRFKELVKYKLCITVYNGLNQRAPTYIRELVVPVSSWSSTTRLRSASGRDVVKPRTRIKFGERGFSFAGPAAWNSLPAEVKSSSSLNTFKARLKAELLKESFVSSLNVRCREFSAYYQRHCDDTKRTD